MKNKSEVPSKQSRIKMIREVADKAMASPKKHRTKFDSLSIGMI
jgi:hypothetical protein